VLQYPGEAIRVQPGMLHQVRNLQPCVKLAFDYIDLAHLGSYAWLHKHVFPKMSGAYQAPIDYIGVLDTLCKFMASDAGKSLKR
jgi:hypothetical protein